MPLPVVRFGEPAEKSNFDLYETDSLKIYVSRVLTLKGDEIRIQLSSFLGIFKNLDVFGFNVI